MPARNALAAAPPYAVEQAIQRLGAHLRMARVRRNLSIEEVAKKIGTNRRVVADAERGKTTTGIVVFAALLWAVGLIDQLAEVAEPARDEEGTALASARERTRAHRRKAPATKSGGGLSDDF